MKDETKRLTSRGAMNHPFLSSVAQEKPKGIVDIQKCELREFGACHDVKERRLELVERLGDAAEQIGQTDMRQVSSWCPKSGHNGFESVTENYEAYCGITHKSIRFEWWAPQKVEEAKVFDLSKAKVIKNINE